MKFKIHLKINDKTYFIQDIDIKQTKEDELPVSTITWSTDKSVAKPFEKDQAVHLLNVLATNGRDYRSSAIK